MSKLRIFHILPSQKVLELDALPQTPPAEGFYWLAYPRRILQQEVPVLQQHLQQLTGLQLVDLHVTDLLNQQLPSHFDYTSEYDVLVFRRLANHEQESTSEIFPPIKPASSAFAVPDLRFPSLSLLTRRRRQPQQTEEEAEINQVIETDPVGFAVFDQVLVSVHPTDCATRDAYIKRLLLLSQSIAQHPAAPHVPAGHPPATQVAGSRLPASPAELMLRMINMMVDAYLNLRRDLTRQLDHWQEQLLNPQYRFNDWSSLLLARNALHHLEEICEDQRGAMNDWIDSLEDWPVQDNHHALREHDLLLVRSRDVLEHIERVAHHVRRMEQSAETAVQIHFNIQGNRTNDIMRALTAITAIFLPLNLIAGIFGMNFEAMPGLRLSNGFWWAMSSMLFIALALLLYFGTHGYFLPNGSRQKNGKPPKT